MNEAESPANSPIRSLPPMADASEVVGHQPANVIWPFVLSTVCPVPDGGVAVGLAGLVGVAVAAAVAVRVVVAVLVGVVEFAGIAVLVGVGVLVDVAEA